MRGWGAAEEEGHASRDNGNLVVERLHVSVLLAIAFDSRILIRRRRFHQVLIAHSHGTRHTGATDVSVLIDCLRDRPELALGLGKRLQLHLWQGK